MSAGQKYQLSLINVVNSKENLHVVHSTVHHNINFLLMKSFLLFSWI